MRSRTFLLAVSFLALSSAALAGPNAHGTLIVHDASLAYTSDNSQYPSTPPTSDPPTVDSQLPVGLPPIGQGWIWKVYAAFPSAASPRLKGLVIGESFGGDVVVLAGGLPGPDDFEITQNGWPTTSGGGVGMSFHEVQTSLMVECYWFGGYGYQGGVWATAPHPTQTMIFVDDAVPPNEDPIAGLSAIGFGIEGQTIYPTEGGPYGACCSADGQCAYSEEVGCSSGDWREGVPCDPNPCLQPALGACCRGTLCSITTAALCTGIWQGADTDCDPNPCCRGAMAPPSGGIDPTAHTSAGPGEGRSDGLPRSNPCPPSLLFLNHDGTTENAFTWQFQGVQPPDFGAFAEGYRHLTEGFVCGGELWLTRWGTMSGSGTVDLFVWDYDTWCDSPGNVLSVTTSVPVSGVAMWPSISTLDLDLNDAPVGPDGLFIGYWPRSFQNVEAQFGCAMDQDGPGGVPRTNFAPGIGYPTGWGHPSIAGYQTQAFGLGAWCGGIVPGACCYADGQCVSTAQSNCPTGDWREGMPCDPNPCPQPPAGACCFVDGSCTMTPEHGCSEVWLGPDTACLPNPCPQPPTGACCYANGQCVTTTQAACGSGDWREGVLCDPNPCPQPPPTGACCQPSGSCTVTTELDCSALWLGPGTLCSPNPCPQPPTGACCYPDGQCLVRTEASCSTGDWREGVPCTPNPCPQPPALGACCYPGGFCEVTVEANCPTGDWREDLGCDPNPCPTSGGSVNEGGVLVVHDTGLTYTTDNASYPSDPPFSCDDVDNAAPAGVLTVWKVYAAFPEENFPRLKALTFGEAFNAASVTILGAGLPSEMDFEIPQNGWPNTPGGGVGISFYQTQTTHISEIYWFGGYGYQGALWSTAPHPVQATEFADDSIPPRVVPIAGLGSIGFGTAGETPCGFQNPTGACCFPSGVCLMLFPSNCATLGGVFLDGPCSPNPCPQPPSGACCYATGQCVTTTQAACGSGDWREGVPCDPNPCPPPPDGACCTGMLCSITSQLDCTGAWQGGDTDCDPNPCCRGATAPPSGGIDPTHAISAGPGRGEAIPAERNDPCPPSALFQNHDGTTENAFTWQFGSIQPPDFGAFAEGYRGLAAGVCGTQLLLTRWNEMSGSGTIDLFVWDYDTWCDSPGNVLSVTTSVLISGVATWPSISALDLDLNDAVTSSEGFFIGYWPRSFEGAAAQFGCAIDQDGPGGVPRTNYAPGIGYPTGWGHPSLAGYAMQAWGLGAWCSGGGIDPGACCYADGHCVSTVQANCPTGDWREGVPCEPNPCPGPPLGACCFPDGHCETSPQYNCPTGDWREGVPCDPNPCPPAGACCQANGSCTMTTEDGCSDVWLGPDTSCWPNPCPQPPTGACCYPNGQCLVQTQTNCSTGDWREGVPCTPNPCPQPPPSGACCYGTSCVVTPEGECFGVWMGLGTDCSPNPCCRRPVDPPSLPRDESVSTSPGPGRGVTALSTRTDPCPPSTLYLNHDGSTENAFTWHYQGVVSPDFGSLAEGYLGASGNVCGIELLLTRWGTMSGSGVIDLYVWDYDVACDIPGNVLSVTPWVNIAGVSMWPGVSVFDLDTNDAYVNYSGFFVGYWPRSFEGVEGQFGCAIDEDGFGGIPCMNIAPGIGYPTGWHHPPGAGYPVPAFGIGGGRGGGATPVEKTTWGRIKAMYH